MFNKFMVGRAGDDIVIMRPVGRLSERDAHELAALLIVISDHPEKFPAVLEEAKKDFE